jgi:hypothetical protein
LVVACATRSAAATDADMLFGFAFISLVLWGLEERERERERKKERKKGKKRERERENRGMDVKAISLFVPKPRDACTKEVQDLRTLPNGVLASENVCHY